MFAAEGYARVMFQKGTKTNIIFGKWLIIAVLILLLIHVGLSVLGYVIREVVYGNKPDPIETAIADALGDPSLSIGSKVGSWVSVLGEPNEVIKTKRVFGLRHTILVWTNPGIVIAFNGWVKSPLTKKTANKVISIMLPTKRNFSKNTEVHEQIEDFPEIKFNKLLDVYVDSQNIVNLSPGRIRTLYDYTDKYSIDDGYTGDFATMPLWLNKVDTFLILEPESERKLGEKSKYARDSIELIVISKSPDVFSLKFWGIVAIAIPYSVIKMLYETFYGIVKFVAESISDIYESSFTLLTN